MIEAIPVGSLRGAVPRIGGSPWLWLVIIVGGLVAGWVLRGYIAPYGPAEVHADRGLLPIASPGSPLGTDTFGRDLVSRLLAGVPVSIIAGIIPAAVGMTLGMAIGLVSGLLGGRVDRLIMSLMDVLLAFPFILLAILAIAVLGPSLQNAMIAVTIAILPRNARIIRAEVLSLRERDYVTAARLAGASQTSILWQHLVPNVLPTALVVGSTEIGHMIASTSGLSFLGLGVQPPDVDWGTLIAEGSRYVTVAPHLALIPSVVVAVVSLMFVLVGDDLRHRLSRTN
ncbi:MAG TPA: ABC transporter permease [Candidatus Limnocylindria bacterium]|nr:ABC transporter permease [Candidatus Limnocylindria bacterium]